MNILGKNNNRTKTWTILMFLIISVQTSKVWFSYASAQAQLSLQLVSTLKCLGSTALVPLPYLFQKKNACDPYLMSSFWERAETLKVGLQGDLFRLRRWMHAFSVCRISQLLYPKNVSWPYPSVREVTIRQIRVSMDQVLFLKRLGPKGGGRRAECGVKPTNSALETCKVIPFVKVLVQKLDELSYVSVLKPIYISSSHCAFIFDRADEKRAKRSENPHFDTFK